MNNKAIQVLRGTREAIISHANEELLEGQVLYNITDNTLTVGGGDGNKDKIIGKLPTASREIKGYVEDLTNNSIHESGTTEYYVKYDTGTEPESGTGKIKYKDSTGEFTQSNIRDGEGSGSVQIVYDPATGAVGSSGSGSTNYTPKAEGRNAFALTARAFAKGDCSVAAGWNSTANTKADIALGVSAEAGLTETEFNNLSEKEYDTYEEYKAKSAHGAVALSNSKAKGVGSFAAAGGIAKGGNSVAFNSGCIASGTQAFASGYITEAIGFASHSEGIPYDASNPTKASGEGSHAEGSGTQATGKASHSQGNLTTAGGAFSHAEGNETTASGESAHAEGSRTQAEGIASHAENHANIALGSYSHAGGYASRVNSQGGFVHGKYLLANKVSEQTVFGRCNIQYDNKENPLFSIGNGGYIAVDIPIELSNSDIGKYYYKNEIGDYIAIIRDNEAIARQKDKWYIFDPDTKSNAFEVYENGSANIYKNLNIGIFNSGDDEDIKFSFSIDNNTNKASAIFNSSLTVSDICAFNGNVDIGTDKELKIGSDENNTTIINDSITTSSIETNTITAKNNTIKSLSNFQIGESTSTSDLTINGNISNVSGTSKFSGNVGIGTDSDSTSKLKVNGNTDITGVTKITDTTSADASAGALQVTGGIKASNLYITGNETNTIISNEGSGLKVNNNSETDSNFDYDSLYNEIIDDNSYYVTRGKDIKEVLKKETIYSSKGLAPTAYVGQSYAAEGNPITLSSINMYSNAPQMVMIVLRFKEYKDNQWGWSYHRSVIYTYCPKFSGEERLDAVVDAPYMTPGDTSYTTLRLRLHYIYYPKGENGNGTPEIVIENWSDSMQSGNHRAEIVSLFRMDITSDPLIIF